MTKIVLITGGNKGLGYASAEALKALGYKVYIGSRNDVRGQQASQKLGVHYVQLDVTSDYSVKNAYNMIAEKKVVLISSLTMQVYLVNFQHLLN